MKTTTNLKSPSRRHLPSLALLLATVTLLAFAPQSARAGGEIAIPCELHHPLRERAGVPVASRHRQFAGTGNLHG